MKHEMLQALGLILVFLATLLAGILIGTIATRPSYHEYRDHFEDGYAQGWLARDKHDMTQNLTPPPRRRNA